MRRRRLIMKLTLSLLCLCLLLAGCKSFKTDRAADNSTYKVHYTATPIKIDGKMDDPAWNQAKALSFSPPSISSPECIENGKVKILWDDKYVYVGGTLTDSDIVQEGDKNWEHLYKTGDLMEVFLQRKGERHYWELYAAPNNKKTSFFFLSKGRLGLPSGFEHKVTGMRVKSTCNGTLNNPKDRDVSWTTEMAIPRKELERNGVKIVPGQIWHFLIGRYNYSIYLDEKELSMVGTPCERVSYHNFDAWSWLEFVKP